MSEKDDGRFVWHDLMTTDLAASARFYSELFGWAISADELAQGHYVHVRHNGREIGGMMPAHSTPTHWIGYVQVPDVDATVARATELGARTYAPPRDIEVGRYAVLGDPQGAAFAIYHSKTVEEDAGPATRPPPGNFCWDELYVGDLDAGRDFYTRLFGWTTEKMEMGDFGVYWLYQASGANVAGMMTFPPGAPPHPYWLAYVAVAHTDEVVARAERLGARVLAPAMDIPGVGRFAVMMDPQQGAFAVLQPGP